MEGGGRRPVGLVHSVGSWYELVVELLQDLCGDNGVIELHKTVACHYAAEGKWIRDLHLFRCSHSDARSKHSKDVPEYLH